MNVDRRSHVDRCGIPDDILEFRDSDRTANLHHPSGYVHRVELRSSPGADAAAIAFRRALGFELEGSRTVDGIPVIADHSGRGEHRVMFRKRLA